MSNLDDDDDDFEEYEEHEIKNFPLIDEQDLDQWFNIYIYRQETWDDFDNTTDNEFSQQLRFEFQN